jgi:type III secretion protein O
LTEYPLAPLARVRKLREDAAETEYAAACAALLEAEKKSAACAKALEDYISWRQEEEERRYQEIMRKEMGCKDLDEFKAGLGRLREKESSLAEELALAQKAEEDAGEAREREREKLRRARKETEKISAHKEIWLAGEAREAERREDLEMEEFSKKKQEEPPHE